MNDCMNYACPLQMTKRVTLNRGLEDEEFIFCILRLGALDCPEGMENTDIAKIK